MADYLTTDTELTSIANAIRLKGGTSEALTYPQDFITAINNIETGGGSAISITETEDPVHGGTIVEVNAVDLSNDTVTADKILSGYTAHDRLGRAITGTASVSSSGLEYETGTWTPLENITREFISFSKTHSEAPVFIQLADATGTAHSNTNTSYSFTYVDYYKLFGYGMPYGASSFRYGVVTSLYRQSTTASTSSIVNILSNNSDDPGDTSTDYPRYYATEEGFYPYSKSTNNYYWRTNRTYKWIAIWKPTT